MPEKHLDIISQHEVIWILRLLPGLERLVSKDIGRSMDTSCPSVLVWGNEDWLLEQLYLCPWLDTSVILSLDDDNDTSRNDSSDNTTISSRLSTHRYFHSIRQQTPDFVPQQHWGKRCYCRFYRIHMFSETATCEKIPSESENVFIIENYHVSPFKKELASCLRRIKRSRKWEPQVREKLERERGAILSCSVIVLNKKPLLRSKKSSYVDSTLLCS